MPMTKDISDEIKQFVNQYISSVASLELLLLMRKHPGKRWTMESLCLELRSNSFHIEYLLNELSTAELIQQEKLNSYSTFFYSGHSKWEAVISSLEQTYMQKRLSVINLIYMHPVDKIRTFANAFKIRKDWHG